MVKLAMNKYDWIAITLLFIGGLTFGLTGFIKFNPIEELFGSWGMGIRIMYSIIGLATIYSIYSISKK